MAPRGDRATKNPRLAERGLFVPPKVSASNLAPFIGGAAAKVNLESVLSGAMALGLAGPTKGGPHDHFHRRRAAQHRPSHDTPRLRSEEGRVGIECVRNFSSWWGQVHVK